ncbi:DegT/DnrJ/EryC1/StrS family aminotransferase [Helicobacter muridarum]|uniref:DegT/DnrJ/EryC1/StrS family aminotransferase n=1 Tax=Helicobacter muridarum TaxID=216 RepID=A0A099TXX4_9HELI|nr:DegT/DnrJ/EryC1/StrS family aminotransferase [Helicobacter muridarum]STQ86765.1 putative DegT/DnrJ/EryC1/StrS aminotransferase [Helicobacter muridarum]
MIRVNKPYLPSNKKYQKYCEKIYKTNYLTNFGPLSIELEQRLSEYLNVPFILLVSNGTLALQIAYRLAGLQAGDKVITTPFSFVATTNTLIWENLDPVFCDIEQGSFCIDTSILSNLVTEDIKAILPVHVFGNPCDVEYLESFSIKHNIKLIYDAAHAFGVNYDKRSVLGFGDISTLSFHATKLFHTVEGGGLILKDFSLLEAGREMINFGLKNNLPHSLGINAKLSEFHAAMGLCVLDDMSFILEDRQRIWYYYFEKLRDYFDMQVLRNKATNNYHYFSILFKNTNLLYDAVCALEDECIFPRRYFYPSLHSLPFVSSYSKCPVSSDIASRILCLPIFVGLQKEEQDKIINIIIPFAS